MTSSLITPDRFTSLAAEKPAVGDELEAAGAAFGELIKATGLAVAQTQDLLNATGAATAVALAKEEVEVLAVQERVYNDNGEVAAARTHTRKLPLLSLIDPVFYQWPSVRVQGEFFASEVTTASSATTTQKAASIHIRGGFGGGSATAAGSLSQSTAQTATASDTSIGRMRLYARLTPRDDVGIPKPTEVIQGPSLRLVQEVTATVEDTVEGEKVIVARTVDLRIEYRRRNGSNGTSGSTADDGGPIVGKAISIDAEGLSFAYLDPLTGEPPAAGAPSPSKTNADGAILLRLRRDFFDSDADTRPVGAIVTARIGMVSANLTVEI